MLFSICVTVLTIFYLLLLELSKNTLPGFLIGFIAAAAFFYAHFNHRGKPLLLWLCFFAILLGNYFLTAPPEKRLPAVAHSHPEITPVLSLPQGDITGVFSKDKKAAVYAGIPYAAPPVGENRFRAPQPAEGWDGVRACDHFGPMAMQPRTIPIVDSLSHILGYHDYRITLGDKYIEAMSEDCLYLNVFAPSEKPDKPLPVVLYIHGGSLTTGQSSYGPYRGETFAKNGVIFVNFAYRLGVFGYYAAEDLKAESAAGSGSSATDSSQSASGSGQSASGSGNHATTGNYGLLDQIAALNWVYDNISYFGGDPKQITIAGESAGASSVNALCVSPLTRGKFRYAIAESSGIVAKEPYHTYRPYFLALKEGAKVRKEMGVSSSQELRKVSAQKLVTTQTNQSAMTLDGYAITEAPYLTYEKGENHEEALLHGFNAKEADAFTMTRKVTKENYVSELKEVCGDFADEMTAIVPANSPARDQHFIIDALGDAKGAFNTVFSAAWFSYSHHLWNHYLVSQEKPSYEYYFTKTNGVLSNYHAGELPYAYGNLWRVPGHYSKEDEILSDIMVSYWTNFAKTGDPNGNGLPHWESRTATQTKLLQLDTSLQMIDDPNEDIYKVLDKYQNSISD